VNLFPEVIEKLELESRTKKKNPFIPGSTMVDDSVDTCIRQFQHLTPNNMEMLTMDDSDKMFSQRKEDVTYFLEKFKEKLRDRSLRFIVLANERALHFATMILDLFGSQVFVLDSCIKHLMEDGMRLTFGETVTKHYKLSKFYSITYMRPLLFKMNKMSKALNKERKVLKVKFFNSNSLAATQYDNTSCTQMTLKTLGTMCYQKLTSEFPIPLSATKFST